MAFNFVSSSSKRISYEQSCKSTRQIKEAEERPNLHCHHHVGRFVENSLDSTIGTVTELFTELELIHVDEERSAIGKVDTRGVYNRFAVEVERTRRVTEKKVRGRGHEMGRRAYTILPKLANGVLDTAAGRRGGHSVPSGTPTAGPAPAAPPPGPCCSPVMSLSLNRGLLRLADIPGEWTNPERNEEGRPESVRS